MSLVAVVVRRHRRRDERADSLDNVARRERARAARLAVRGDLACEAADAAWWEVEPHTGHVRASAVWGLVVERGRRLGFG